VTPLSDALTAAQRSALAALEKAYVAGQEGVFYGIGYAARFEPSDCGFRVHVFVALDVLREWGVSAPTMSERITEAQKDEPASQKQLDWIAKLVGDKGWPMPEGLSKEKASQAIDELQAGTYDPEQWELPF
jgi:hypothetical protein